VVPTFAASADFAIDKPAGQACPNLRTDFRCGIHNRLREKGFTGCTVYDCFGAGQRLAQSTFGGRDWRTSPELARTMYAAFPALRDLHELLYYVTEAAGWPSSHPIGADLRAAAERLDDLGGLAPEGLASLNVNALRDEANPLLVRASTLARSGLAGPDLRGTDLIGQRFRGARLRGASLRGALLVGADLRDADLRQADLIGADLRGADVSGADLTGALFVTRAQLDAARGSSTTRVPAHLPSPWRA
jgi:uncharacterized protein YjbI with pentapeptide repeats